MQVKRAMVEGARVMCGSVRVERKNLKNVWWNNQVKSAFKRREAAWKEVFGSRDEDAWKLAKKKKKKKRKVKRCIYQSKKEVNDIFGSKMNEDNNGNRKLVLEGGMSA